MPKLARFRAMSPAERGLLAQVLVLLPLVAGSLRVAGFRRTYRWLARFSASDRDYSNEIEWNRTGEAVALGARNLPVYRPTCLPRSLVLWHLLRRRGANAVLRIGVRTENGQFLAHAWVENNGEVINDAPDVARQYAPVDLPASLIKGP